MSLDRASAIHAAKAAEVKEVNATKEVNRDVKPNDDGTDTRNLVKHLQLMATRFAAAWGDMFYNNDDSDKGLVAIKFNLKKASIKFADVQALSDALVELCTAPKDAKDRGGFVVRVYPDTYIVVHALRQVIRLPDLVQTAGFGLLQTLGAIKKITPTSTDCVPFADATENPETLFVFLPIELTGAAGAGGPSPSDVTYDRDSCHRFLTRNVKVILRQMAQVNNSAGALRFNISIPKPPDSRKSPKIELERKLGHIGCAFVNFFVDQQGGGHGVDNVTIAQLRYLLDGAKWFSRGDTRPIRCHFAQRRVQFPASAPADKSIGNECAVVSVLSASFEEKEDAGRSDDESQDEDDDQTGNDHDNDQETDTDDDSGHENHISVPFGTGSTADQ